jgi:glycosyltransferase involved in cell wall biosynthesis
MTLSVVLITRNQDWNIARLIRSVTDATADLGIDAEIALVDSASTDQTVDVAKQFPIDVYELAADQRLTAAAGRHVGLMNTTGDYVLFMDGDMELIEGWLPNAVALLDKDPTIAAVGGQRIDLPVNTVGSGHSIGDHPAAARGIEVKHTGGAALYRRSVLEEVGGFNPFIYSDEEPELCIRIRYRGDYRVIRLQRPIGFHYSDPDDRISTLFRRARRNLYVGAGQNLRMLIGSDLLVPYARERGFGLIPGAWLAIGIGAALASATTGSAVWLGVWCLATLTAAAFEMMRKRSIQRALHSLVKRYLIVEGTVRGFVMRPEAVDDYPARLVR